MSRNDAVSVRSGTAALKGKAALKAAIQEVGGNIGVGACKSACFHYLIQDRAHQSLLRDQIPLSSPSQAGMTGGKKGKYFMYTALSVLFLNIKKAL